MGELRGATAVVNRLATRGLSTSSMCGNRHTTTAFGEVPLMAVTPLKRASITFATAWLGTRCSVVVTVNSTSMVACDLSEMPLTTSRPV
eukprot:1360685-Prymnesium_polylepis.1